MDAGPDLLPPEGSPPDAVDMYPSFGSEVFCSAAGGPPIPADTHLAPPAALPPRPAQGPFGPMLPRDQLAHAGLPQITPPDRADSAAIPIHSHYSGWRGVESPPLGRGVNNPVSTYATVRGLFAPSSTEPEGGFAAALKTLSGLLTGAPKAAAPLSIECRSSKWLLRIFH